MKLFGNFEEIGMCVWASKTTLLCSLKDCFRKGNLVFIQLIGRHKIKEHEVKKEKKLTHQQNIYPYRSAIPPVNVQR